MAAAPIPSCETCGQPGQYITSMSSVELTNMIISGKDGCLTCFLLREGVDRYIPRDEQPERVTIRLSMTGGQSVVVAANGRAINFYIAENGPLLSKILPRWPIGYEIPESTASSKSLSWALERLQHCNDSHPECAAMLRSPLPKRVLDIGNSDNPHVRLYQSQGEIERYVCLSHCWGTHSLLRTLSTNIEAHQQQIPWDALPATYQETIIFVRKLQVRYLWIDSLCIVQDNTEDWREEAAKMASIYQGSYLTISAPMSAMEEPRLFSEPASEFEPYRLPYPDGADVPPGACARLDLAHAHFPGFEGYSYTAAKLRIFRRGWILQERLLSPRVLHFLPEEMNWECLTETVCQCSGTISNVGHGAIVDRSELSMSPKRYYSFARLSRIDGKKVERRWRQLVGDFSTLEFTLERDIFPAISGLVREFGRARDSAYLAGLWDSSLLSDMVWYTWQSSSGPSPTRPKVWRAPTWSWASTKGRISFKDAVDLEPTCQVVSVACSPAGLDPAGELIGGEVQLRGQLVPCLLEYKPQPESANPFLHGSNYKFSFAGEGRELGVAYPDYNFWVEGPGHVESETKIYLFPIGRAAPAGNMPTLFFLMLRCVDDDPTLPCQVYERIGLVLEYGTKKIAESEMVGGAEKIIKVI